MKYPVARNEKCARGAMKYPVAKNEKVGRDVIKYPVARNEKVGWDGMKYPVAMNEISSGIYEITTGDMECRNTLLKNVNFSIFTYKPYNTLNKITMITRINGQAQSS